MDSLAKCLIENELIINLKKGKTEALLFGTSQRVSKQHENFNVRFREDNISITTSYKYLGVELNQSLNINSHFDKCYKRASSRLSLMSKIRNQLTAEAAKAIYQSVILPNFTYCSILNLNLTSTQIQKLESFHCRAEKIVGGKQPSYS